MAITIVTFLLGLSTVGMVYSQETPATRTTLDTWYETYGIERPWDNLSDMPVRLRRHRGTLAHVYHSLKSGEIPEEALAHLHHDLGHLIALKQTEQILQSTPAFTDYQAFFEIDVFRLWQQLITETSAPIRWNTTFKETYYSQADGAGVLFKVHLPAAEDLEIYPLLVALNRGPQVTPNSEFPFIQVTPSRGGIWGYRAISGHDIMQVIAFLKAYYPVDPDRIYLTGFSAGASGAMHLASCFPDEFAAVLPLVAVGNNYPLSNFKNLPVAIHHGTDDRTSSICNARVQHQKMQELGCPVILKEYPGIGHSVPKPHAPLLSWLLEHTRNSSPPSLTHQCETPALGRAYWIHIREFQDPHQRAFIQASIRYSNDRKTVFIQPENVQAFTLDLNLMSAGEDPIETIEIEGTRLITKGASENLNIRFQERRWQATSDKRSPDQPKHPYHAGAAANLYQGEPLLIVYGTGSDQTDRTDWLRSAALKLAAYGGPSFSPMVDRFPVVADTALSPQQEANCNLILVGTPEENSITHNILPKLPILIQNNTLIAAKRPHLPLRNQVLSLLYPHPKHPKRLVYLIAPFTDKDGLARFGEAPQRFLVGSDGFDRISQADLTVQNLDNHIARQMQFGKGWNWVALPDADQPIPARYSDRANLAVTYLEIMKQKSGADFAFWWGPEDKGMWGYDFNFLKSYNPDFYTQADYRTRHELTETMTGGVSGLDLKEIWNLWGKNKQLLSVPEIQVDSLADQKHYRIHIPMDLYIKLGQRKKALDNPKPGPTISSEEVIAEIFQ